MRTMFLPFLVLLFWLSLSLEPIGAAHAGNQHRNYVEQENGVPFNISGQGKWNTGGGRTTMDIHVDMGASPPLPGAGPTPTSTTIPPSGTSVPTATTMPASSTNLPSGTTVPTTMTIPTSSTNLPSGTTVPPPTDSPIVPITAATTGTGSFSPEETEALDVHNKFRAVHNSPPMTLNREMSDAAAAYAQEIAASGNMKHSQKSQRPGQGENLSMGCSTNKAQSMTEAVTNWYNEVCQPGYQFGLDGSQGGTGHFTQVVWKESLELGIGRAEATSNGMKCAYIVGRYKPPGNFNTGNNDYVRNVQQGSFNKEAYCATVSNRFRDQPKQRAPAGLHAPLNKKISGVIKRAKLQKKHH